MIWGRNVVKHIGEVSFDVMAVRQGTAENADRFVRSAPAFDRLELQGSIARTKALKSAPPRILRALSVSAGSMLSALFDHQQNELAIAFDIEKLADATHTAVSGDLGAGFADVMMRRLGFVWQANAAELSLRPVNSTTAKRPDFAYWAPYRYRPGGIGCLVEAKGTTSSKHRPSLNSIVPGYVRRIARKGYVQQIAPFVGQGSLWCGCAIAFGTSAKARRSYAHCVMPPDSRWDRWDWPLGPWPIMFPDEVLRWDMAGRFGADDRLPLRGGDVEVPSLLALVAFRALFALTGHDDEARLVGQRIMEAQLTLRIEGEDGSELEDGASLRVEPDTPFAVSSDPAPESPIEMERYTFRRRSSPDNPAVFALDSRVFDSFLAQLEANPARRYFTLPFFQPRAFGEGERRAFRFSDGLLYAPNP